MKPLIRVSDHMATYSVVFLHYRPPGKDENGNCYTPVQTEAQVTEKFHGKPHEYVRQGVATVSPTVKVDPVTNKVIQDKFSYDQGRKIALAKALKGLPKETRTIIWKAYLTRNTEAARIKQLPWFRRQVAKVRRFVKLVRKAYSVCFQCDT